jgi:hypothetical protein
MVAAPSDGFAVVAMSSEESVLAEVSAAEIVEELGLCQEGQYHAYDPSRTP